VWSVSRQNLMAADVARRGLTRFGEVSVLYSTLLYSTRLYYTVLCIVLYCTVNLLYTHSDPSYLSSYPTLPYPTLHYPDVLDYPILSHIISSIGWSEFEQHCPVYWGNGGQIRVRIGVRWEVRTLTHTHTHTPQEDGITIMYAILSSLDNV
jgi:hypothetical protein